MNRYNQSNQHRCGEEVVYNGTSIMYGWSLVISNYNN